MRVLRNLTNWTFEDDCTVYRLRSEIAILLEKAKQIHREQKRDQKLFQNIAHSNEFIFVNRYKFRRHAEKIIFPEQFARIKERLEVFLTTNDIHDVINY